MDYWDCILFFVMFVLSQNNIKLDQYFEKKNYETYFSGYGIIQLKK